MYKIQKGVPVPKVNHDPKRGRTVYPFETMEIGDMFFAPEKTVHAISPHVSAVAKKLDRKFTSRQTHMALNKAGEWELAPEDAPGAVSGVGVWRTK